MEDFNENLTIVIPEPPDQTEGDIIKIFKKKVLSIILR